MLVLGDRGTYIVVEGAGVERVETIEILESLSLKFERAGAI